jgi:hypothetical protein
MIKNVLWGTLTVELADRTVTLEPRGVASLSDEEFQSAGCQKLLKEEKIIVLPEESQYRL